MSIGEFAAIENERMIPQQAASTLTNVDDDEGNEQPQESGPEEERRRRVVGVRGEPQDPINQDERQSRCAAASMGNNWTGTVVAQLRHSLRRDSAAVLRTATGAKKPLVYTRGTVPACY